MHRSKSILVLGALVALLPFVGFPRVWEAIFQVVAGLSIVGLSTWSSIDKKLSQKAKAELRQRRRSTDAPVDESLHYGRRATDAYPKTGQMGRRLTDVQPTSSEESVN